MHWHPFIRSSPNRNYNIKIASKRIGLQRPTKCRRPTTPTSPLAKSHPVTAVSAPKHAASTRHRSCTTPDAHHGQLGQCKSPQGYRRRSQSQNQHARDTEPRESKSPSRLNASDPATRTASSVTTSAEVHKYTSFTGVGDADVHRHSQPPPTKQETQRGGYCSRSATPSSKRDEQAGSQAALLRDSPRCGKSNLAVDVKHSYSARCKTVT